MEIISCIKNYWLSSLFISLLTLIAVHFIHEKFFFNQKSHFASFVQWDYYTPYPYIMFKGKPKNGWHNEIGYRGQIPVKTNDNTYRIFILGGSAVANGDPPFHKHLENLFHKNGKKNVKVYNFGAVSSIIAQDLNRIIHEVVNYQPDLVILYNGYNELTQPFHGDPRPNYPFNFMIYEKNPFMAKSIDEYPFWLLILYRSSILREYFPYFFFEKFTEIDKLRKKVNFQTKGWKKNIVDSYINNTHKIKTISNAFNFKFISVLQPALSKRKQLHKNEKKIKHSEKWGEMHPILLKTIKQRDLPYFYDRSSLFDHIPEQVFIDSVHINEKFRPIIADELYEIINKNEVF